jgi:nitrogen fixation/metabolism regulation signal transduction histidine kinase
LPSSPIRLVAAALTLSIALAGIGLTLEATRFGLSNAATAARLEREVRGRFWNLARQVESLATRVAREEALVAEAATRDRLPALFNRLKEIGGPAPTPTVSTTVYVAAGPGAYRVLAWSDGRSEDLTTDRLASAPSLFVERGTVGLRLVFVQPIAQAAGRRTVAAAEAVLSPITHLGVQAGVHRLDTTFGPVVVEYVGAGEGPEHANRFVIAGESGAALLEVRYSPEDLAERRNQFRRRALAIAALPVIVATLLLSGPVIERRGRAKRPGGFLVWTLAAAALLSGGGAAIVGVGRLAGAPGALESAVAGLGALGFAALLPVSAWGRAWGRRLSQRAPLRFMAEQLLAGVVAAASVFVLIRILSGRVTAEAIDRWQFPLFPIDVQALLHLGSLLVVQLALCWTAAAVVAVAALRWRVTWHRPGTGLLAMALWTAPVLALAALPAGGQPLQAQSLVGPAAGLAMFGVLAESIRRTYRQTTQAMRLILVFAALILPTFAAYPMAAVLSDRASRTLIEREYAPATARHSQLLLARLGQARDDVDRIPNLPAWVSGPPAPELVPSQAAFQIWSRTNLSRSRVTSQIELFGSDRLIVSRFALNLPEYPYDPVHRTWDGAGCSWDVFGEVTQFGSVDRPIFTAQRGVCDEQGRIRGAIVIHVAPDFQALPFVPSANPYYDVVAESEPGARTGSRLYDLQVAVYGWSLQPLFTHGRGPWPISREIDDRLYRSRDPFWIDLDSRGRTYRVHFSNDRAGVYALGFPAPTLLQHVMRLAELTAVLSVVFVMLLIGAAIYTPFARRRDAPLRLLFDEIRTSFYRKLFLFFVLAAIVPVLLFAVAFGAYMTARLRTEIESESAGVVTVARRALEALAAANRSPGQTATPTDDVLVWIRQVIDQDVNLFEGSRLVATSQRDLFESGLLPKRTPAAVYRAIALDRLPTVVTPDQLGAFQHLVAAAPVPALGRDAIISIPLATRQREIDHQIDELNRGVLVGAVIVVLFAAALGTSVAGRVSDPVARLTRATRQIAAGRLDVRLPTDTIDELGRLVEDFNSMAATLVAQRGELARTNQLKAWAEMARQVAHEIKNPLTPIQLAAEHMQRVHDDRGRPLGPAVDQCVSTILRQVRLLRQIASEFSTFAGQPVARPSAVAVKELLTAIVSPYELGLGDRIAIEIDVPDGVPPVWVDRTLIARALTNLVENAVQAMPDGGRLTVRAASEPGRVAIAIADTGVGMEPEAVARAFEPYFSTKTAGSGLGLANAKRNIELNGGTIVLTSQPRAGTDVRVTLPVAPPPAVPASG